MKKLLPPLAGILIVIALVSLTGCKYAQGIEFGIKLEDRKVWIGAGLQRNPMLAERETLEGEPPYEIRVLPEK